MFLLYNADYGSSFPDVVQGLENILESLGSDHSSTPSSFRYKDNLEKQVRIMEDQRSHAPLSKLSSQLC